MTGMEGKSSATTPRRMSSASGSGALSPSFGLLSPGRAAPVGGDEQASRGRCELGPTAAGPRGGAGPAARAGATRPSSNRPVCVAGRGSERIGSMSPGRAAPVGGRRAILPGAMRTGSHCGRAAWRCWSGGTGRGDTPQLQPALLRRRQGVGTHRLDVAGARRPGKFQLNPIQERNLTAESPATAAQRPALYVRVAPSSPRRSVRLSLAAAASLASNTSASRVRFSSCSASTRSSTVPVAISL